MGSNLSNLEKLVGRENFTTWKFTMKIYLQHEDLWCCIELSDNKPIEASKDVKAKAKLILLLDPQNYVHVQDCSTEKETSTSYTPEHNGLAERMNRTLVERARCMLFYANLEKKLWAEALATAAYIVNRSPTKALEVLLLWYMYQKKNVKNGIKNLRKCCEVSLLRLL
ncbi:uncharacterized protein LOC130892631 [Diorhabda carinulata]|uniref:uncharacterized protein LOC130892631 n=1 Tax=Diorhabda carinulata TaxID=1163345 RepID=UPI0025A2DB7D|nr:uncharacterized protein LOC130892631 [Diorhabda carinulata]